MKMKVRAFDIFAASLFSIVVLATVLLPFQEPLINQLLCFPSWPMVLAILCGSSIGEEHLYLQQHKKQTTGLMWTTLPTFIQGWLLLLGALLLFSFILLVLRSYTASLSFYILTFIPSLLSFILLAFSVFYPSGKTVGFYPFLLHLAIVAYTYLILLYLRVPVAQKQLWSMPTLFLILSTLGIFAALGGLVPPLLRVIFYGEEMTAVDFHRWIVRLKLAKPLE